VISCKSNHQYMVLTCFSPLRPLHLIHFWVIWGLSLSLMGFRCTHNQVSLPTLLT